MGYNLSEFTAVADRRLKEGLYTSMFKRCVLANVMFAWGGTVGRLGRPGMSGILSGAQLSKPEIERINGSAYTDVFILAAKSGGGKVLSAEDTVGNVVRKQNRNYGSARFFWTFYQQPIEVDKMALNLAGTGEYQIQNAVERATDQARDELMDTLATDLWSGLPSTYNVTAANGVYDRMPGVVEAMSSTNQYGNVNRSATGDYVDSVHPWAGNTTTTALPATTDIIETANATVLQYGDGVDLAVTTIANYQKIKAQMRGESAIVYNGVIPGRGQLGFLKEFLVYGRTVIMGDPFCPSGYFACFTMEDWTIEIHSSKNFDVAQFDDSPRPGDNYSLTSQIEVGVKPYCRLPKRQFLFTGVS